MDKHLKELYNVSMGLLLKDTQNKYFFTQKEYEQNRAKIGIIHNAKDKLEEKLKV